MKKSLIALAFGTLGLGIAEFVIMGVLPDVAAGLGITIAKAGHLISAYTIGVCVGAPMLAVVRKFPLKKILLALAAIMTIGNILASLSPNYGTMLLARFLSGLPHGAYFGVASIVAEKLADKGKGSEAVSIMIAGMTVANLLGVPLGTAMSVSISWRSTFLLAGIWGIITFYYIWRWIPQVPGLPDTGFKGQFRFLKSPAPWLILLATMLGNGGVFSFYSYVNPLLTQVAGFAPEHITILMVLAGFGMVVGNLTSGKLSDRYSPGMVAAFSQGTICCVLLALFFLAGIPWMAVLLMCICTTGLFAVSTPQQVLIIRHAPGGELLGAASIQVAFNLGNAIGAYAGGLPLEAGKGYQYPALVGVPFAFCGFMLLLWFHRKYERK
ncbi:MAG: MFS transporter AraJ [Bacteroides sp.]|nr:MFS transporter AraJ [Bacteroides sp.]